MRVLNNVMLLLLMVGTATAAEPPTFYRGINVGGPAVKIDGRQWRGDDTEWFESEDDDRSFHADDLALHPETTPQKTKMLRSFRGDQRPHLAIRDVPNGLYSVKLWVLEDTQAEQFDILVEGMLAADDFNSGKAGTWQKLGPWAVDVNDGKIDITSEGGYANFAGIAIWKGVVADAKRLIPQEPPRSPYLGQFADQKPRVVVLTDIGGDPDDQQSMVRFLLYSCDFEVEGLLATLSRYTYHRPRQDAPTSPDLIRKAVKAYGKVFENLRRHRDDYPQPAHLMSLVKAGHKGHRHDVGDKLNSAASRWIIHVLEEKDPRPVWFVIWGGPRELAQALWQMERTKSKKELTAIKKKIRVYSVADQDKTAEWIKEHHPDIFWIYAQEVFRGMYSGGDQSLVSLEWAKKNVLNNHGPLGDVYPTNTSHRGVKEGDTPSFLYLLQNGLSDPEAPSWGSWGGRFRFYGGGGWEYRDAADTVDGETSVRTTVRRWRQAYQNAFAARMDWCVQSPKEANHRPVVICQGDEGTDVLRIKVAPGETISLSASGSSDPDNDELKWHWWVYPEPSTYDGEVNIRAARKESASITIPKDAGGQTIHVILEVTDNGDPALTAYRRVIIECE